MTQKIPPQEILQLTHTFLTTQVFPVLDWPELEQAVDHWIGRHDGVRSMFVDTLPALVYDALGGYPEKVVPLNSSWLLYLIAARVFDDIQDGEGEGRPWNKFGLSLALPLGIGLMSAGGVCLSHNTFDGETARALQQMFCRVGVGAAQAQQYELIRGRDDDTLENYFSHIIGATAKIFAVGTRAGGYLYGVEGKMLDALSDYGFNVGMKSAIIDDCQDLMASEYSSSDLVNGRYRLPILYAMAQPDSHRQIQLQALLTEAKHDQTAVGEAVALLETMGAITWCLNLAQVYRQKALDTVTGFPENVREVLAEYV